MRYEIKNGKNKTYYFKNELKEFGCQFKKTGKYSGYWYLNTDDQFLANRLQAYCCLLYTSDAADEVEPV